MVLFGTNRIPRNNSFRGIFLYAGMRWLRGDAGEALRSGSQGS